MNRMDAVKWHKGLYEYGKLSLFISSSASVPPSFGRGRFFDNPMAYYISTYR